MYRRWRDQPLLEGTVLYESYQGSAPSCNPAAIFERLLADPQHAGLTHVWALTPPAMRAAPVHHSLNHPRVRLVRHRSAMYFRYLARASHLVNNVTFPLLFDKREDQVYVNTWHGTPYKRMGRDIALGAVTANTSRDLGSADVLLSSGGYMTSTMYVGAYDVDPARVVEVGSPRVDVQFESSSSHRARRALAEAGIPIGDGPILLYAPTWREASWTTARDDTAMLEGVVRELSGGLSPDGWTVLLRVHGKLSAMMQGGSSLEHLVPDHIPTNALLPAVDALVTDYSSIFFDHLATADRMYFLTPDLDEYCATRGLYLTPEELPGPSTRHVEELIDWVSGTGTPGFHASVEASRARFCAHEDGHATERVASLLMG